MRALRAVNQPRKYPASIKAGIHTAAAHRRAVVRYVGTLPHDLRHLLLMPHHILKGNALLAFREDEDLSLVFVGQEAFRNQHVQVRCCAEHYEREH